MAKEKSFTQLMTEMTEHLSRPLPGGRGAQFRYYQEVKNLAEELSITPLPQVDPVKSP